MASRTFAVQFGVLAAIAAAMTAGVYGLVAGIVKLDDAGLHLSRLPNAALAATGRGILRAAPWLMKALAVAGTVAMFLVGGGILTHGVRAIGEWIEHMTEAGARVPGAGALIGALTPTFANATAGIIAGGLVLLVVKLFERLRAKPGAPH